MRLRNNREVEVEKMRVALLLGVNSVQSKQGRGETIIKDSEMLAQSTGTGQRRGSNKY
jgi:hypothetical protein